MSTGKTILVVDDDHELRAGLQAVLQHRGYRTLAADDGVQAKELINDRPDLVILDMMMPRWGGFAVLEHYHGKKAPPFIMITGSEGDQHRTYAEQVGVVDYLRKPFSMDRVLERVDKALNPAPPASDTGDAEGEFVRCRCGGCGGRIKASVRPVGQARPCPRCRQPVLVKRQPPQDEGPLLMLDGREPIKARSGLW